MSLEKLGRLVLKQQILEILDKTHSATLSEIVSGLPEEIRASIAEDRERVILETLLEMIRDNVLALIHIKKE
ncbi:MAG: hypothetical protein ACE5OW_08050 [Candidatus Bathyarchaeia archaeon]